jgi:hypothetical protein
VLIVLVAKFVEGAWITVLAVPLLILLMRAVRRHYDTVSRETRLPQLTIENRPAPMLVVPISRWDTAAESALRFACSISDEVQVLHVNCRDEDGETTSTNWQHTLDDAVRRSGVKPPSLVAVQSPFRAITTPILNHVLELEKRCPDRVIGVVVPELVASSWYEYLLHNHRSTLLKAQLLIKGNRRVVVINVPWYLHKENGGHS